MCPDIPVFSLTQTQAPSVVVWVDESGIAHARDTRTGSIIAESADHASVLQAACDALKLTGGTVLIKSGVYQLSRTVNCYAGTHIRGEGIAYYKGVSTTLLGPDGSDVINVNPTPAANTGFSIADIGIRPGANGKGVVVTDVWYPTVERVFIRPKDPNSGCATGIEIAASQAHSYQTVIRDCEIADFASYGVKFTGSPGKLGAALLEHNWFTTKFNATMVYAVDEISITNNYFEYASPAGGTAIRLDGVNYYKVIGNIFAGQYTTDSKSIHASGGGGLGAIVGNVFVQSAGTAVYIQWAPGYGNQHHAVVGNVFLLNGGNGVYAETMGVNIVGNVFRIGATINRAITLTGDQCAVGNVIEGFAETVRNGTGIYIPRTPRRNIKISNNVIKYIQYGVYVDADSLVNSELVGNTFVNCTTPVYGGGKFNLVRDNIGVDPQPVSTVGIPANATTTIGPFNYPVQVILSAPQNATSVSLTRGGIQTPLPIQSSYLLYPGDTLSVAEGAMEQTAYIVPL